MPMVDLITTIVLIYFAASGFLSGASALATTLAFFITVYFRIFISSSIAKWVFTLLTRFGITADYVQLLSTVLAFLFFYLVVRMLIRSILHIVLPSSGIGRILYAAGSALVNGFAYFYLLNSLLSQSSPLSVYLLPYFKNTFTLQLLQTIFSHTFVV